MSLARPGKNRNCVNEVENLFLVFRRQKWALIINPLVELLLRNGNAAIIGVMKDAVAQHDVV